MSSREIIVGICLASALGCQVMGRGAIHVATGPTQPNRLSAQASPFPPVSSASMRASSGPSAPVATVTPYAIATASQAPPLTTGALAEVPGAMLAGTIAIDAQYVVSVAAGKVIGNNGSSSIANNGSAIVANNGGGLIANNGGGVLAVGSAVISNNAGNYRLLDFASTAAALAGASTSGAATPAVATSATAAAAVLPVAMPPGSLLPVAGMRVQIFSLVNGKPVSIWQDPNSAPLTEIFTDGAGKFSVHVPAAVKDNVLLVASVPGTANTRLTYQQVTAAGRVKEFAVDEDTAIATEFVRTLYAQDMDLLMFGGGADFAVAEIGAQFDWDASVKAAMTAVINELQAAVTSTNLDNLSPAAQHKLGAQVADAIIAGIPLDDIPLNKALYPIYTGPPSPALPALEQVLSLVRRQAASRLFSEPNYFTAKSYLTSANQGVDADHAYSIKKPADVGDFIAREFYGTTKYLNAAVPVDKVFWDLGVNDNMAGGDRTSILHCAIISIGAELSKAFQSDTGHAKTNALAVIKAAKAL